MRWGVCHTTHLTSVVVILQAASRAGRGSHNPKSEDSSGSSSCGSEGHDAMGIVWHTDPERSRRPLLNYPIFAFNTILDLLLLEELDCEGSLEALAMFCVDRVVIAS